MALHAWLDRVTYVLGLPVAWLLGAFRVRFLAMSGPSVIGHFAAETDHFIALHRAGEWGDIRPVLAMHRFKKPNRALLGQLARHVTLLRHPAAVSLYRAMVRYDALRIELRDVVRARAACAYYRVRAERAGGPPSIVMGPEDDARARPALEAMAIPEGRWLATIHAREGSYDGGRFEARNARIETYLGAVEEIVARGGWCLRMGDAGMTPAPEVEGLVDYAHTGWKSDFMDVWLIARARIFVGSSSGLRFVAGAAETPVTAANMVPFGASLLPETDAPAIPKLVRDRDGRLLGFAEIAAHPSANELTGSAFFDGDVELVDNDTESIRALVLEALDRLDAAEAGEPYPTTPEDEERQTAFRRLITPRHYCYWARGRVGADFLRRHEHLL